MKNPFYSIRFLVLLPIVFSCTHKPQVEKLYIPTYESINFFLLDILETDTNDFNNPKDIYPLIYSNSNISKILNQFPEYQQLFDQNQLVLHDTVFAYMHLNPRLFLDYTLVDQKTFDGPYRIFRVPLFSRDGNYALVDIGYKIGLMSGYGNIILFKKEGASWVELKRFRSWIE